MRSRPPFAASSADHVTDVEWMTRLTHLFGWTTPGDLKVFPLAERDAAVAWAAEPRAD
jgi:hypothetical protein